MKDTIAWRVRVLFGLTFAVVLAVAFVSVRNVNHAQLSSDWVNRTHGLIYELDGMKTSLETGEGLMRTYVLTQDRRDFAEARGALAAISDHLEVAKAMLRDDPAALARLETIAAERVALADSLRRAHDAGREEELRTLLRNDSGSAQPAEFRREIERLRNRQFELLSERDRDSYRQAHATRWIVGVGVGLNLLLSLGLAWLVRADVNRRRQTAAILQAANESLEQRVRERTAELTEANKRLTAENRERKWAAASQEHQLRYNQLVINSVNDLVFVLTKALNVTRVNPAVPRRTGFSEEQLLGRPLASLIEPADGESIDGVMRNLKDGRETHCAAHLLDHEGRRVAVRLAVVPLRDNDAVVGGVAIVQWPG